MRKYARICFAIPGARRGNEGDLQRGGSVREIVGHKLMRWPFMLKSTHLAVQRENYTLRDALREANKELAKHRQLLSGIRSGQVDVVTILDKMRERA